MKPLTIVQHEPDDPPGSIAVALNDLGVPFTVCRVDQARRAARVARRDRRA